MKLQNITKKAIKLAGGPTKVSALYDPKITPEAVCQWKVIPANRVLVIEEHSGISRHELRPDVFGKE